MNCYSYLFQKTMEKSKSKNLCVYIDCNIRCNFNFHGLHAMYCASHKLETMINVNDKTCLFENCEKQPNYNYEGNKKGIYCLSHKEIDMVNVVSKICIIENCEILSSFNYEGNKIPIYCACHKLEGMINIKSKRKIHETLLSNTKKICFNKKFSK